MSREASGVAAAGGAAARTNIVSIQVLRAVAALLVVFVHLDVFLRALGVKPFGHGGVDLFFVISGFIMVYTTRARAVTPAAFMWSRFSRIAPIYWLITLAVYAVALSAPSLLQATVADPVQLAKSLAFVPFQKSNGLVQPLLFVGWTLNYEMFFYALFALSLVCRERWLGASLVVGVLALLVSVGIFLEPRGTVASFYTRPILLEFAAGMGLAALGPALHVRSVAGRAALVALGLLSLGASLLAPLAWPGLSGLVTRGAPAVLVVGCAIALHQSGVHSPAGGTAGGRGQRLWLLLGDASYSIYLTHPFVTQAAQKLGRGLASAPAVVAAICLTIVLVCLVGIATHRLVERPLTALTKAWLQRAGAVARAAHAAQYARSD